MTTSVSQFSMLSLSHGASSTAPVQPPPIFGGEKTADAGDEVRFVCEITRVRNLDELYVVECKRMKGGPWTYGFLYETLLSRLELGAV
jgi:protein-serine/threonine kinase